MLYNTHRPSSLSEVVGQGQAVSQLKSFKRVPQALLFVGPSGCGKTTLARIMAARLKCSKGDFREINAADVRGIDGVRSIRQTVDLLPMSGPVRITLIDECQQLTKDAQSALLKMLEDTPKHAHFMLCTTDPQKLLPTIKTRCAEIVVRPVDAEVLKSLLTSILDKEKKRKKVSGDVIDKIIEAADGSPRMAVVKLEQVIDLDDEDEQLEAISRGDTEKQAIDLCRVLLRPRSWPDACKILKDLKGQDAEQIRRAVLGYATSVILNKPKGDGRAYLILEAFGPNTFDTGHAGVVKATYEVAFDGQ